jgi:hypothetical protein
MPYIKQLTRKVFTIILNDVSYIGTATSQPVAIDHLMSLLEQYPPEEHDGILNYLFTSMLRWQGKPSNIVRNFIHAVIMRCYLMNENYYKLERCVGLLVCMKEEFKRRDWMNEDRKRWFDDYYAFVLGGSLMPYEDQKIEENGDLP